MSERHHTIAGETTVQLLQRELADSARASGALQQMVDTLASLPALESFVPAALRIVADVFKTTDCAYYEHRKDELIKLRYWFFKDEVFGPAEIRSFGDDHQYAGVKILEEGFLMPDTYLGVPFRQRVLAQVVSHEGDRPGDVWYDLRRRLDWYTSLNVPLVVGGEADGALLINRGRGATFSAPEIQLAERLGQQLALAMQVDRLAASARTAAASRAREQAVQLQLDEMAKTDWALRQTTDALAAMPDLENFIPAALKIVATAFNAKDCGYYEHRRGDPIRLKYWFLDDRVLSSTDIAALDGEDAFMRSLSVDGFTVPDNYVGSPFRLRTKASVVDHAHRTDNAPPGPDSVFDVECMRRGWHLELNVPLVVAGEADGALLIYRSVDAPFTPREIALAERLAQQLALAMEASRLSAAAKDAAVTKERERAAREREAELARHADALKQTIDSLVEEKDFRKFISQLLIIASEQTGSPVVEYWLDNKTDSTRLVFTCRDGIVYTGSDVDDDVRVKGVSLFSELVTPDLYSTRGTHQIIDLLNDLPFRTYLASFSMPIDEWCRQRHISIMFVIPLMRGDLHHGSLILYFPKGQAIEQARIDLAFSLGQQICLAARMTELADESKQSALVLEREAAANNRAVELIKANTLLRSTLEQLSDERDLLNFPSTILRVAMEQCAARDGAIFAFDPLAKTLEAVEYMGSPQSPKASRLEFFKPFPADNEPIWAQVMASRAPIVYDIETQVDKLLPGAADWHRKRGNRSVMVVPMFVNMEAYGYFGMGLPQPATAISDVELELVQALTQQASLAIQLTRLAEESKQTAVAREYEKAAEERAAEFANANEVLKLTLDQLSKQHDLQSFPRTILQGAMRHTGARDGLILLFDKQADTLTPSDYINSEGLPASSEFASPFSASGTQAWCAMLRSRAPVVFDVEEDAPMLLSGLAEWHRRRGNRSIIAVAMFIDSEPYGYFGITLGEPAAEVSSVKVGLIQSLAQQATLAIQLTRLAEESKQTALAQEREKAAEVRASELANANDVLRSTLDQLSKQEELQSFPRTILRQAMSYTGAKDGLTFLLDKQTNILNPLDYINIDDLPPHEAFTRPCSALASPSWALLLEKRAPMVFTAEGAESMLPPALAEWHRQRGNRSILATAMFIDSEPYGYFGITLEEAAQDVSSVKIGLIQSLSQQATLALQLTQLAEKSQQAAVMVERQQVVVQERANMAREIHDRLAQGYAAILIQQHTMRRSLLRDQDGAKANALLLEQLDIIERLSRENLAEARRTMDELSVDPFGLGDLASSLERCVGHFAQERDFVVSLNLEGDLPALRRYVETELCRIVSEAVTNAKKHARSKSVEVSARKSDGELQIAIRDGGVGFNISTVGSSFGISSMEERAARAGGRMQILSKPGVGTEVRVVLTP